MNNKRRGLIDPLPLILIVALNLFSLWWLY